MSKFVLTQQPAYFNKDREVSFVWTLEYIPVDGEENPLGIPQYGVWLETKPYKIEDARRFLNNPDDKALVVYGLAMEFKDNSNEGDYVELPNGSKSFMAITDTGVSIMVNDINIDSSAITYKTADGYISTDAKEDMVNDMLKIIEDE